MPGKRPPLPSSEQIDRLDLITDRVDDAHRELNGLMERYYQGGLSDSCCSVGKTVVARTVASESVLGAAVLR